jgi:hypothetical protein
MIGLTATILAMIHLTTIQLTMVNLVTVMLLTIIYLAANNLFMTYGSLSNN